MAKANPLVTYYSYIFAPFTIIAPIILYFGYQKKQSTPKYYEYIYSKYLHLVKLYDYVTIEMMLLRYAYLLAAIAAKI